MILILLFVVPSAQISPRSLNSPSKFNGEQFHSLERVSKQQALINERNDIELMTREPQQPEERPQSAISNNSKHADIMTSEWAQVQAIELVNDGTGLGFGKLINSTIV